MHAIRSECHGHPVSASRGETKEQNCTWGKRGRKKGTGGSLAECQAPANEGRTGARSRALGSWASFYCAFLFSQGQRVPAACYSGLIGVVWSTRRAHCAGVEGGGGAAGGGRTTREMLAPRGIGLQGWGSPSLASFTGLHSSGHADSKHICCCCSHHAAAGAPLTALPFLFSRPFAYILCRLCLFLNPPYWSSAPFIFHQNLFPSRRFLFLKPRLIFTSMCDRLPLIVSAVLRPAICE